jgi:hypothetical protein
VAKDIAMINAPKSGFRRGSFLIIALSLRLNGVFIDLNSTEQTEKVCSVNTEYALH